MALTGLPFLVVLVATAAALMGATMLLWNRWPWPWAAPIRLLFLLLLMAAGVVLVADIVNRDYDFYTSFNELLGHEPVRGVVVTAEGPSGVAGTGGGGAQYRASNAWTTQGANRGAYGRVIRIRLNGARSGVSREALVYLPAAYFQPSQARRRFPVIELFHGYPGSPTNWTHQMRFAQTLDAEIAAGRMPPVIAVAPAANDPGRDSECVDAVQGQRDETYLALDVPADIERDFRALDTRAWATLGYSTGGFCAVNIALHHPDRYAAAASLSGYYTALVGGSTGDLYRGHTAARRWNSPLWVVAHRPANVAMYLVASRGDPSVMWAMTSMRRAADDRWPLVTVTLPAGATTSMSGTSPACPPSNGSAPTSPQREPCRSRKGATGDPDGSLIISS
jgi:S-formylglutathione hydrolase FrmB